LRGKIKKIILKKRKGIAYLFKLIILIRTFDYINKNKRKFKQEKKYGNTKY